MLCSCFFSYSYSASRYSYSYSKRSSIAIRPIDPQVVANCLDQRSASSQLKQPSSTSTVTLSTVALSTSTMEKECMDTGTHAMHHGIGSAFRYFDKNSIAELRPFGWRKVTKCPCPSIGINSQSTPTSFARSWNRTDVSNGTRRSFVP